MSYRKIGDLIQVVDQRNRDLAITHLVGLTINKKFIPSVANIIGTDMSNYKIIRKNQFACSTMQVRRDKKMPVALLKQLDVAIISQAYPVFEVIDEKELLPEYLMLWFSRSEFDREACFHAVGGVRGSLEWEDFCNMELPVPSIEKQREIVAQYQAVENKIKVNEQICEKLEATAQAIYRHWFVDFEFPNEEGQPYKSSGGTMVYNQELEKEIPEGWEVKSLSDISKITMGQSPEGENYNDIGNGKIFYQGRTDFGFRIPDVRIFTTLSKKNAKKGDVLMSVRAPVGDLNIADSDCSIGRGIAALSSKESSYLFYLMKSFKSHFELSDGTGTIFSSINKEELFNLKVIYNENYSKFFHEKMKHIDYEIILISKQNQKLTQLQSLLLSRLATLEG